MAGIVSLVSKEQTMVKVEQHVIRQSKVLLSTLQILMDEFRLFLACFRISERVETPFIQFQMFRTQSWRRSLNGASKSTNFKLKTHDANLSTRKLLYAIKGGTKMIPLWTKMILATKNRSATREFHGGTQNSSKSTKKLYSVINKIWVSNIPLFCRDHSRR